MRSRMWASDVNISRQITRMGAPRGLLFAARIASCLHLAPLLRTLRYLAHLAPHYLPRSFAVSYLSFTRTRAPFSAQSHATRLFATRLSLSTRITLLPAGDRRCIYAARFFVISFFRGPAPASRLRHYHVTPAPLTRSATFFATHLRHMRGRLSITHYLPSHHAHARTDKRINRRRAGSVDRTGIGRNRRTQLR